jgi:nitrite reductase/ring-hydroxylating ferredoxin subunit
VTARRVNRFVSDLLRGRRPKRFRVEEHEAAELRAAITLRAARQGAGTPREEFVTDLRRRLADHVASQQLPGAQSEDARAPDTDGQVPDTHHAGTPGSGAPDSGTAAPPGTLTPDTRTPDTGTYGAGEHIPAPIPFRGRGELSRRRMVATTGIAAGAAAVVGAGADHLLNGRPAGAELAQADDPQTLEPNVGQWRTVAASADLPEGGAAGFDLGTVAGFVARQGGAVEAVSAMCTHLGCRLALNAPARRLDCPCHNTSFALDGELLRHQLPSPPPPLPKFHVRESNGTVQVFAPPEV